MESKPLVPKLRFPEFRNAPAWEEKSLRCICSINPSHGDLPERFIYIDLESVEAGHLKDRKQVQRQEAPSRAQRLLRNGDVLFQIVRPYQRNNLYMNFQDNEVYVASTGYAQLRTHESHEFLYQLIHTDGFVNQVVSKCTGSSYPAINSSDLSDILVQIPSSTAEQQKIAECLTSLDELIEAERRKLEALRGHKTSLMQDLFPREGETIPRHRFPEFQNAGHWEEKLAGKLFANRVERGEASLPIYSVTMNDGLVLRSSLERKIDDITAPEGNKKVLKHDLAYNMMRMWQGASGVAPENCLVSPAYVVLAPLKGVCSDFYADYFKLPQTLHLLTTYSRGLTKDRLRLYYEDFRRMPLLVPGEDEQRRIADCLASVNALISIQADKLEILKLHKQGLMQGLFPSSEEAEA